MSVILDNHYLLIELVPTSGGKEKSLQLCILFASIRPRYQNQSKNAVLEMTY